jgi:hypothetical protein
MISKAQVGITAGLVLLCGLAITFGVLDRSWWEPAVICTFAAEVWLFTRGQLT